MVRVKGLIQNPGIEHLALNFSFKKLSIFRRSHWEVFLENNCFKFQKFKERYL